MRMVNIIIELYMLDGNIYRDYRPASGRSFMVMMNVDTSNYKYFGTHSRTVITLQLINWLNYEVIERNQWLSC